MGTTNIQRLVKCAETGRKEGCPRDQIERLMSAAYIPLPWQWSFHSAAREADESGGPVDIGLGGARGPGKSHAVLSQVGIDDCQRVKGLKVLFLRQTGVAAKESFADLVDKVLVGHVSFRRTATSIRFKNGSRVILGGFKDERDIDKYIGIEYDIIIVEELNQLTAERYQKLRGSLRTSKPNWRPRMYTSFNPGGKGHSFVKERYVLPHRAKKQKETRFIPATYKANPHTNEGYIEYLESLGGDLGKAWREGEWDLFSGQYFAEWRHTLHVVEPRAIPQSWFRYRSIDVGGRNGTTSCHWYAVDNDGNVWPYREYYYGQGVESPDGIVIDVGRDHDEHAKEIARLSMDEDGVTESYQYTIMDGAAFAKAGFAETVAEIYERNGVTGLLPAFNAIKDRVPGWNSVHQYMRWSGNPGTPDYTQPKLRIFSTCANMIRTIPLLQHDEIRPEDVDSSGEDHAADELRYLLRTLRETKAPKPLSPVERRIKQIRERESAGFDYQYKRQSV